MILEMKRSHKSATFFILGKETVAEDDCVAYKEDCLNILLASGAMKPIAPVARN